MDGDPLEIALLLISNTVNVHSSVCGAAKEMENRGWEGKDGEEEMREHFEKNKWIKKNIIQWWRKEFLIIKHVY